MSLKLNNHFMVAGSMICEWRENLASKFIDCRPYSRIKVNVRNFLFYTPNPKIWKLIRKADLLVRSCLAVDTIRPPNSTSKKLKLGISENESSIGRVLNLLFKPPTNRQRTLNVLKLGVNLPEKS